MPDVDFVQFCVLQVNIAFGPPFPELVPQDPDTGLRLGGQYDKEPRRFVFKKAHLSREDFRIFDQRSGRLVCVSHHYGKNPYESLDPMGLTHNPQTQHGILGEMESLCHVTGASRAVTAALSTAESRLLAHCKLPSHT